MFCSRALQRYRLRLENRRIEQAAMNRLAQLIRLDLIQEIKNPGSDGEESNSSLKDEEDMQEKLEDEEEMQEKVEDEKGDKDC